jgi:tetratricopeptide (TPR) repeat protein
MGPRRALFERAFTDWPMHVKRVRQRMPWPHRVRASKLVSVGESKQRSEPDGGAGAEKESGNRLAAGPSRGPAAAVEQPPQGETEVLAGLASSQSPGLPPEPGSPELEPGVAVGRYELVEQIGSGGMGSVYRAHDPHLSRDVALKVLNPNYAAIHERSNYRQRLLREAQALAKLSHPNVVAAFDVGTYRGVVFVAMELVQGESLRGWLLAKRGVPEVLRVLIAAGRGLVAAHTAGVLHRDFKPANVMVSPDGRVRVVDFGLARSALTNDEPDELDATSTCDEAIARERGSSLLEGELTESGLLMGTPGYIAPERLRGEPANALADQYSFAVTAFVALTRGALPPPDAVRTRSLAWPREVPSRVRRVIERGLAPSSAERHPSVAAMVDSLEQASSPRRRAGAVVALALGAAALAGGATWLEVRSARVTCQVGAEPFEHVWDAERRAALHGGLAATGRANADEAFGLLSGRLDAFQAAWLAMKRESCEATHVRGEQSEKVLALRNICLESKLAGTSALVSAFSRPDAGAVDRAAGAMPESLDECADTAALLGTAEKLPADAQARATIARIESQLAVERSLSLAGQWTGMRERFDALLAEARSLGHERTIALALREVSALLWVQARTAEERQKCVQYLREAIPLAARAGDDRLAARASSILFNLLGYMLHRDQEAEAMLPSVEALVIRAGDRPEDRLEISFARALMLAERRKFPEAIALLEQMIVLSDRISGKWRTPGAMARANIGEIFLKLENYPEALRYMQAALEAIESIFGGHHPRMLIARANLALAQSKVDGDAALATVAKMRELAATLPSGDWRAVTIPFLEGQIREDRDDCAHAVPFYREALPLFTKTYGAESTEEADVQARLGACLEALGQRGAALLEFERALATRRANGNAPSVIAQAAYELAQTLASPGAKPAERERAIELGHEARTLWQQDGVTDKVKDVEQWLVATDATSVRPTARERVAKK